ncbi:MAG: hypothetical protein ABSC04_20390 [Syntrophobacteraceae bacterium]|jgi:phosphoglycerol transferase MdoB-like AlkP superfamily enzyme
MFATDSWPCVTLLLFALFNIAITLWLLRHNPGLLRERIGYIPNQKTWDKIFIVALNVVFLVWLILMPLDAVRFHWSRSLYGFKR